MSVRDLEYQLQIFTTGEIQATMRDNRLTFIDVTGPGLNTKVRYYRLAAGMEAA